MIEQVKDILALNVEQMTTQLSNAYIAMIKNNTPFKKFPSVMLWGPPGVGKSQGVRQVAAIVEEQTGKEVVVTDVRLLLFNPVDLRGIPTSNAEKTLAVWLKPQIFQMNESEDVVNILFLDEISAAPQSVQAAAYQITLDRTVGEHRLPDNCIVIAAGNRVTDKSVAYNMPKALANRMCHLDIKGDERSWHDWAVSNGIHKFIIGYLEYNSVALMKFDPSGTEVAFPTPRSWEMASNILKNQRSDCIDDVYPLLAGCIGTHTTYLLKSWSELYTRIPSVEDIFAGREVQCPKTPELRIALRTEMVDYARKHPSKEAIDYSIEYACSLPWAFRGSLLHDYYQIDDLRPILKGNVVFQAALKKGVI